MKRSAGTRRQRVLLMAKGFLPDPGGIERYSYDLANAMNRLGYQPIVVTQRDGATGVHRGEGYLIINVGSHSQPIVLLKMLWCLRLLRRRYRFTCIHATTWRLAIPALLTRFRAPVGITLHGREVFVPRGAMRQLMMWVLRQASQIFAVSDFTLEETRRRGLLSPNVGCRNWNGLSHVEPGFPSADSKLKVENPDRDRGVIDKAARSRLDVPSSGPSDHRHRLQLFTICRLVPRKNLRAAIAALGQLKRLGQLPAVTYTIAGTGPSEVELRETIRQENLENEVKLAGRIDDQTKHLLYLRADLFLHPQISLKGGDDAEGFGLVVAEAMAYGVTVLVGCHGGTGDFVSDGETGCIVDGHDVGQIADRIADLLGDADQRRLIGTAAQRWTRENLSWDRHAALIVEQLSPR